VYSVVMGKVKKDYYHDTADALVNVPSLAMLTTIAILRRPTNKKETIPHKKLTSFFRRDALRAMLTSSRVSYHKKGVHNQMMSKDEMAQKLVTMVANTEKQVSSLHHLVQQQMV